MTKTGQTEDVGFLPVKYLKIKYQTLFMKILKILKILKFWSLGLEKGTQQNFS